VASSLVGHRMAVAVEKERQLIRRSALALSTVNESRKQMFVTALLWLCHSASLSLTCCVSPEDYERMR
jgi:hypothetical protein